MLSVTPRFILAGAILSVLSVPTAFAAPTLIVNHDSIAIQTPASEPGLRYQAQTSTEAALTAYTDGFLLCANVGSIPGAPYIVSLVPRHEAGGQQGAHQWAFPAVTDAFPVIFRDGTFSINVEDTGVRLSTLSCNALGAQGEWAYSLREMIFADGFQGAGAAPARNYRNMVNWNPPGAILTPPYDWSNPAWAGVPQDPCVFGANDTGSMRVEEAVACGAATGVTPLPQATGVRRGPTMWVNAWSDPNTLTFKLTYVFRVDATLGAQPSHLSNVPALPVLTGADGVEAAGTAAYVVRDAFDETYLSAEGSWCLLTQAQLPATLDAGVCANGTGGGTLNAQMPFVSSNFGLSTPPGTAFHRSSFYIAVTRTIIGGQNGPGTETPVVAASVFVEPAAVIEGANQFRGDDVVFGFMPGEPGFPWMKGGSANP